MDASILVYTKLEQHVVIRFLHFEDVNPTEIYRGISKVHGCNAIL